MNHESRILAAADQFGWTAERRQNGFVVLTKNMPMIDRTAKHRVVVQFNIGGRIVAATYGSDRRPFEIATPLLTNVLELITR